jgi:hypothetical protein
VTGDAATLAKLRVYDEAGAQVPSQVDLATKTLRLVSALPRGRTLRYAVRPSGEAPAPGGVSVTPGKDGLVLRNRLFALRLPVEQTQQFNPPVPASSLLAPILGFQQAGDPATAWLGAGRLLTDRPVKALTVKLVANGPILAEMSYEILWAAGGYYRASIQVIDQVPLAMVSERYDLGVNDGTIFWELDLTQGWQADRAEVAANNGNGGGDPNGRVQSFADLLGTQPCQYLVGDQAWGRLSHLGVFNAAERQAKPGSERIAGVVPLRKGLWRRSNALEVYSAGEHDLRVRLPLGVRPTQWDRDITSATSPFSTQEYDSTIPATEGRRVWGLALGPPAFEAGERPFYQLRRLYGIIGLDRYKDFILAWPDTQASYPRLYRDANTLTAYRAAVAAAPDLAALLGNSWVASGDDQVASKNLTRLLAELKRSCRYYFIAPEASHHGTSGNYFLAALADDVLAWPGLPPEARQEIRARLALITFVYEDGDMMSYGNGHHHGNPNMGTARFWSGPCFMALLPDHPQYTAWRAHLAQYGAYNIATQMAPGGGYFEFGAAYHMHGFARTTNGLPALARSGAPGIAELLRDYVAPDWAYYMNLLTPFDSRWQARMIPGMANSPPGHTRHFIEAAGALAATHRPLAEELLWAWDANGGHGKKDANLALADPTLKAREPVLQSQLYPGVGVVFRAHQGPDETYAFMRCGFQWSHWYVDPGHLIVYSRGASLLPFQPYQYGGPGDPAFNAYTTIRFGDPTNDWPHGWGDANILSHAFAASVDYAWASTGFPDWFIKPGIAPEWQNSGHVTRAGERKLDGAFPQQEGAFTWDRQVLFLKGKTAQSPNYFVFRDTTSGPGKLSSYFNLNLLGTAASLVADGPRLRVNTQWPVGADLAFAQPAKLPLSTREERFQVAMHDSALPAKVKDAAAASPDWIKADGTPWTGVPKNGMLEQHVLARIAGAPGDEYFWVLYPRRADEPAPELTLIQPGVLKITHPAGTDLVWLSPTPLKVQVGDFQASGTAGAIRVTPETVTFNLSAPGSAQYQAYCVLSADKEEVTIPLARAAQPAPPPPPRAPETLWPLIPELSSALEVAPGVQTVVRADGQRQYRLLGPDYHRYQEGGVTLEGESAWVVASRDSVRLVCDQASFVRLSVGPVGIRGVGPFDLTFTKTGVTGSVGGRQRSLAITWPDGLTRPMFRLDGTRYYAGWSDDHSIGKGQTTPQFSIGFGVTDGRHTVDLSEATFPDLPAPLPPSTLAF